MNHLYFLHFLTMFNNFWNSIFFQFNLFQAFSYKNEAK